MAPTGREDPGRRLRVGRDALAFAQKGFSVEAFDASIEMVRLARERTAGLVNVQQMRFEDVDRQHEFDGIWACASLLHVPLALFSGVADQLVTALRSGGAWYMSFKLGVGERHAGGRYFADHTEETLFPLLAKAHTKLAELWVSEDLRPTRKAERWLNVIAIRSQGAL